MWYIVLPGTQSTDGTSGCRFALEKSNPVLDCLGATGRNEYLSLQSNGRWYLLKVGRKVGGDYAGTVKDGGSTVCLRKAGCYHLLAEVREVPTELPSKLQVPAPGNLTLTYGNEELSFSYPQNWQTEEKKNKDNVIISVNVAAPEAQLGPWVTHGFFVGHVAKMSSKFPQTLDGAYDQFSTFQRQRGLVIADAVSKTMSAPVGESQGHIATYTSPSPFSAGESGWVAVVKDKSDGYYWVLMFYPPNDDSNLYSVTFAAVLKSFKFKK